MTIELLLERLAEKNVGLTLDGDELVVRAPKGALDAALVAVLREQKPAVRDAVRAGAYPPAEKRRPALAELDPAEAETVAAGVPGGAANVQDVYPLGPLQEGILFHHLMAKDGDPYLLFHLFRVDTRARVDAFLDALRAAIRRHDILRTAVVWEGLREPVQVVWRQADLDVEEVEINPAAGDARAQLWTRIDPRRYVLDVRRAPMLRAHVARDGEGGWLLLLARHHLTSDHVSVESLIHEVRAHMQGRGDALPASVPFRNFVAQTRAGAGREAHEAYFRAMLGDVDEPTAPFGLLDVMGDSNAESRREVDRALGERMQARARALRVSTASLCHVACAAVLGRVSGRDDVVFGTVLFGRLQSGAGADRALGPFINTLPVRVGVGAVGVEAGVRRMHAMLAELMQHEHASLALAQRCSRVPAPTPLFTALLNYRHSTRVATAGHGADAAEAWAGVEFIRARTRSTYPLMLSVDEKEDGFVLSARAEGSVDTELVCALMETALERIVDALETAPETALASLDILPPGERRRVPETWNATDAAYPRGACLHDLVAGQAARTPDAEAVLHDGGSLTYRELDDRSSRLANHLRRLGVGPETRVGICLERAPEMVAAILGVLKAGGAYVPLDPAYPAERLAFMLRDSAAAVLVTQESLRALLPASDGARVVSLDGDAAAIAAEGAEAPRTAVGPRNLAYLIYTSGSTGAPKGVAIEHESAVAFLAWASDVFTDDELSGVLAATSICFDLSVFELFLPLSRGGRVIVVDNALALATSAVAERVRLINTVPSAVAALLKEGGIPAGVKTVNLAGEPLRAELVDALYAAGIERVNDLYGPSEDTTYSTWTPRRAGGPETIGRPIANTRAYVLDSALRPVPAGVAGELYLAGKGLARGYLGRPALTADRFVPDPFGREAGGRMYRTGDRARWNADGTLAYLGRVDAQVKVRGFRIELGEIEARLREHPGVRDAVVLAREDVPGDRRLVAYHVDAPSGESAGGAATAEALRAHLAGRLPEYMVPAAYVRLEALPLTPNGKVDRKALPAPEADAYGTRAFEAPVGETETALAEIWADVLGVERIGRWDHFFEIGGHSLLAVQVISRVKRVLDADVALSDVFDHPVLAELARTVEGAVRAALPPIAPADRSSDLPLSFAQQRLWFLEQLGTLGSSYHVWRQLRFRGELDGDALRRALDRIVARHEALRTTFAAVEGQPVQRIAPAEGAAFALAEHDLRGREDADGALRRLVDEEARETFDLARGPLIRGRLVRMAEDDHVLLLTMHHVVSDAWSMGVLVHELSTLYAAFLRGEDDPLPPLPVQYADYAAWQRAWVDGDVLRAQAEYWTRTLAGIPELLELPMDRPRPARRDHAGAAVGVELDAELTAALKTLGRRHGTTLFMTLLAGWAVVLARLSRRDDVVLGTPTANRGRREIEGLIGFFVNTLALRVDLSGAPTVAEVLKRVKERALGAQANQDIPFEQVVDLVQPSRSLSHTPLFQVLFAWQNAPGGALELPGLELAPVGRASRTTAKFDLSLTLREEEGRIVGGLTYATSLFERETAERFLGYLRSVLVAMAADATRPVAALAIVPAEERARTLGAWNATGMALPPEAGVHQLFAAQAARTPGAVAVVHDGGTLEYAEVEARANRLAHFLVRRGVGPDVCVGICAERSPEMVIGLLAILKAGGAYVPLDPAYPEDRLRYMLEDSRPAVLLTQSALGDRFADLDLPRVALDADAAAWAEMPRTAPEVPGLTPDHLVYVIYTSGSTGRPKGVANVHRNLTNRLWWGKDAWGIRPDDAVLLKTSLSFDGLVRELFLPLMTGGRIVLAKPEGHKDAAYLLEAIRAHDVTTVNLVPSLFQLILEHPEVEACRSIRRIFCTGEALPTALVERARERLPWVDVHNIYGPSEAATATVGIRCVPDAARTTASIGRPAGNTRIYVLDGAGEPAPVGVAGEVFIGGAGVARGYLRRPALTAEKFVPHPFSADPGARLYRTGDLGRWLADGTLEFVGRDDDQVKVRGFRIELGEIEARLAEHPAVREAVAVVREDAPGDKRIVAYYVGEALAAEAVRAHLAERLPEYMIPAAYVRLDAVPLTPNGKVDRRALPAPDGDAFARRGYEAPAGEAEEAVAEIWADVLGAERVGRWDHFFEMGGHSLLAVQVVSRVRQVLSAEVALGELFQRPVLADFAQALETARRADLPPIERADRGAPLPLSFAQQRLWFLEEMGGVGNAYHLARRVRLGGELDRGALGRALDRIVARHEALRTTFVRADGEPVQRIAPEDAGLALLEHDLSAEPDRDAALRRVVMDEARTPFDLAAGPLIRGRLVRMAADDHVLILTLHHIVSDGWSMGILVNELGVLYAAFRAGRPDPLPPLPVQYADYAAWQRRWIDGEGLEAQASYWRRALAGAPELLELPADRPRPAQQSYAGGGVRFGFDEALTAGLKALSRRHGTTLFNTLLAGWAAVLSRLSGQTDVVIGTPTANRGRTEIEGLIGFFINTLALRVDLSGSPSVAELLGRVKARALEAQQNQDIPFEQVVEIVRPARSLSHTPLFQVMFAWQSAPGGGAEMAGLETGAVGAAEQETAKFDLWLSLRDSGGRLSGIMTYATSIFDRETVERHLAYLRRALEEMVAADTMSVDRLAILPAEERRLAVEAWNATEAAYPRDLPIHRLFEAQAARTPGALAVVSGDDAWTYAELNARANRLAHHLRALGVGAETRVAVCVERGAGMVAALLAVMKAGGAYVPLDPSHPAERLRLVVDDGAPAVVLAQARHAALFAGLRAPVVDVTDDARWVDRPAADVETAVDPEHPAYVMYTSGSTGRPKGVAVPHRGVVNLLRSMGETVGVGESDRVLALTTYAFDISVLELFLPLVSGARTIVLTQAQAADPAALSAALRDHAPTVMQATPATWRMLVESGWEGAPGLRALCGGEALPADLAAAIRARVVALWNVYGPTETSIWSTVEPVGADVDGGQVAIGRPVANTRIYVLDARGEPVPIGAPGEIHVGGDGVARGYLNRPALTAERFVPDPFSATPGARMYRTGDLGRRLADGRIVFAGRVDFQVKVRGYRIELGEIEARLAEHPAVREAVVTAREDAAGDRRLVAYVVGEAADAEALRAHLAARVPEYMVPAAYVRLDAFPLNANGKVDRKALPAPAGEAYGRRAYEAPVGEVETALAEIWSELLRVEPVGRWDGFFVLGGHSLLAVRLIDRMRQRGFRLGVRALFTTATLADLAATVRRDVDDADAAAEPAAADPGESHSLLVTI